MIDFVLRFLFGV